MEWARRIVRALFTKNMNYKDVELLNGSLDNLGSTLMRNRVLAEQEKTGEEQRQERLAQIGLEQERVRAETQRGAAAEAHYGAMQKQGDAANQQKAKDNTQRVWSDTVKMYGRWVKDGVMRPESARGALNMAWQNMPSQSKALLADHPDAMALDKGTFDFSAPPDKASRLPAAAIQIMNHAQDLRDQADGLDDSDPDQADYLRNTAQVLEDHVKKNPPKAAGVRKTVRSVDAATGGSTSLSGPLDQVDALTNKAPAAAPALNTAQAKAQAKAKRANELRLQNPTWSKQQVIDAVNSQFP